MLFRALEARLLARVNASINNGEFTERGLARLLGVSQPQLHNVLKGARKLRPDLADRLMIKFNMGISDLLEAAELAPHTGDTTANTPPCTSCPFQSGLTGRPSLEHPLTARKSPSRALSMDPHSLKWTG